MTKTKNKDRKNRRLKLSAARPVVAEDLRVGDGVTVARVTTQFLATEDPPPGETQNRVLTATVIPGDAGQPLRVEHVCLPFVLARNPRNTFVTLDLRRQHLVRLDPGYTRLAFKKLGPKRKK